MIDHAHADCELDYEFQKDQLVALRAEVARLTAQVAYEQDRNANNFAMADAIIKDTCEQAFKAGMARAIGSHMDFEQTHPTFEEWWAKGEK